MGGRGGSSGIAAKSSEEISLDKRFRRYDYNGYTIYNSSGGFSVYNFNKPPTPIDNSGKHKSHLVFYRNRLKDAKASIDANIRYKEQQAKKEKIINKLSEVL